MPQLSNSGRVVTLLAVSQGTVFYANAGDTDWTLATNLTGDDPALEFSGIMLSASNNQRQYFSDGVNWVFFDPALGTVNRWAPSAGLLPVDSQNNTPRLICTWRGRTVLSGLLLDPQDVFMSAVGDPTDFDYSPLSITPTQAVAFTANSVQNVVGDSITSLCPYTDDVIIFFGNSSIYMLQGDPMAGGQKALVTSAIGGCFGVCWCMDPYGNIFFLSNKVGVYMFTPGQQPQRISQAIESLLVNIDTGANGFRLIWDDRFQGFHLFCTPLEAPGVTTHFFYEARSGAWWTDQFASTNFDPLCVCTLDGNTPGDRVSLIGSWDGYVRAIDPTATTDDGLPIASEVVLGPLLTVDLDDVVVKDLQAILGATAGTVTFSVYVGATAEIALASDPVLTGSWGPGRNLSNLIRRAGHALYIKLSATSPWALETCRARIAGLGKVRRRGH